MMEMAGRMGMSEIEFELTTPRYFFHRMKGFEDLQVEHWQRTRMAAFYAFLPHAKKNALRKPSDMFHLPGDQTRLPEGEELAIMAARLKEAAKVDWFGDKINAVS